MTLIYIFIITFLAISCNDKKTSNSIDLDTESRMIIGSPPTGAIECINKTQHRTEYRYTSSLDNIHRWLIGSGFTRSCMEFAKFKQFETTVNELSKNKNKAHILGHYFNHQYHNVETTFWISVTINRTKDTKIYQCDITLDLVNRK